MITKEKLEKEMASLLEQEAMHIANVQMVRGAMQLCQHLISECEVKDGEE